MGSQVEGVFPGTLPLENIHRELRSRNSELPQQIKSAGIDAYTLRLTVL